MKSVNYEYKCRRCGEIENSLGSGEKIGMTGLMDAIHGTHLAGGIPIRLISVHSCKDGGKGICDLIGHSVPEE